MRSFLAVADRLNFSQAAVALHITQPALSRQIRDLEHELGCRLFERRPQGVTLTADGEALRVRAERLVQEADRLSSDMQSRVIWRQSPLIALPAAHPLSTRRKLHLRDLAAERLLVWDEEQFPGFGAPFLAACRGAAAVRLNGQWSEPGHTGVHMDLVLFRVFSGGAGY